jgi:hypothetical protein
LVDFGIYVIAVKQLGALKEQEEKAETSTSPNSEHNPSKSSNSLEFSEKIL